jgi:patatin-like phospholipase/acyl hydrolase
MAKKILSIDGGGMHGVVPLAVCIAIEKRMGKKLKDIFDLFVGTSTGSLISAAALRGIVKDENGNSKSLGISAENILKIYFERAEDIFGEGARNRLNIKIPILNVSKYPEYKAEGLKKVVNEVLGGGGVTRMGKAEKRLSISAYDVKSREPHFFRSWQEEYKDLEISDANQYLLELSSFSSC